MNRTAKDGEEYYYEETCPTCDSCIGIVIDSNDYKHYSVICPECGQKMMLCWLCHDDYGVKICDWNEEAGCVLNRAEKGLCEYPKLISAKVQERKN